jgi:gliding motility-associated lipoprotein GldH
MGMFFQRTQSLWRIILVFFGGYVFFSCSEEELFSEFHSFPDSEWEQQDIIRFQVPVQDTISRYEVFLEIRNNNDYPFRNIWMFIDYQNPQGDVRHDTLHAELADIYGKWYGKGISLYTYTFPYSLNTQYPDTGTYVYTIRQGMRKNPLPGISDIGLRVSKKTDQ